VSGFTRGVAWLIVVLRWPIVLAWAAAGVATFVYLPSIAETGRETSLTGLVPKDAESLRTGVRLERLFDVPVVTHTYVVQRNPSGFSRERIERAFERARLVDEKQDPDLRQIEFALPLVNRRGLVPASRENGTTIVTSVFFDPRKTDIDDQNETTARFATKHFTDPGDWLVGITGAVPARVDEWREIEQGLPWVTLATLAAIALILGWHFRSPVAPLLTLAAAGVAYAVSIRGVAAFAESAGVRVPRDAEPVLVVLLLGIVTDYAVFFLHGMRERLEAGEPRLDAARESTAEYLPIVVTAGLIVAGGTASLVAGELEFFRAFGPAMALTVLVCLVVAITLVPALIAILGPKAFWPSRRARPAREGPSRVALWATSRPVAFVIAAVALAALVFAARGLLETDLGITQIRGLPDTSGPKKAQLAASTGFSPGILSPTVLLLEGVDERGDLPGLVRLQRLLERQRGIAATIGPGSAAARRIPGLVRSEKAPAVRFLLVLDRDPQGAPAIGIVQRLRARLPALLEEAGLGDARPSIAGDTALAEETVDTIRDDLVRIGIVAFLVNFVLLAIFLRALIAPLYLVFASAAALAASIGLTTLFFQGFLGYDDLTYHVPFAVAVLLLSLGSDYNVFVVGRIWQAAETMPLREAIATAAPRASRAIGVAGLALALSFASLALIDLREFREFAFAMCVGVLLDAFVVRALLIPALISLVGERSTWPRTRPGKPRAEAV
jgi:putative drug exporter of the RND superfamily